MLFKKKPIADIDTFINECCILEEGRRATTGDLYRAYGLWSVKVDCQPVNIVTFGKHLKTRFETVKKKPNQVYGGIGIEKTPVYSPSSFDLK